MHTDRSHLWLLFIVVNVHLDHLLPSAAGAGAAPVTCGFHGSGRLLAVGLLVAPGVIDATLRLYTCAETE